MVKKYLFLLLIVFSLNFAFAQIGSLDEDNFEGFASGNEGTINDINESGSYNNSQSCTANYAELREKLLELQKNYLNLNKKYDSLLKNENNDINIDIDVIENIKDIDDVNLDNEYIENGVLNKSQDFLNCLNLYDPVCGKDKESYSNLCKAQLAGVEVDYKGFCKELVKVSCKDNFGEAYWCDSRKNLINECGNNLKYNQVNGVCDENGNFFCGACVHNEDYLLFKKPEVTIGTLYAKIEYGYGIENYYDYSASIKDLKVATVFRYWNAENNSQEWKILTNGIVELGVNYKYPVLENNNYNYEISDYYGNKIYSGSFTTKIEETVHNYTVRCYFLNRGGGNTIDSCYYGNKYCRGSAVCNINFMEEEGKSIDIISSCNDQVQKVNLTNSNEWKILMFDCNEVVEEEVKENEKNIENEGGNNGEKLDVIEPDTNVDPDDKEGDNNVVNIFKYNSLEYDPYKSRFFLDLDFTGDIKKYNRTSISMYLNFPKINATLSSSVYLYNDNFNGKVYFYAWGDLKEKVELMKGEASFIVKGVQRTYEYLYDHNEMVEQGGLYNNDKAGSNDYVGGRDYESERYIPPKITETVVFGYEGISKIKTLAEICPYCVSAKPKLWMGDGDHEDRYDILIIFENQSEVKINQYLEATFKSGSYSLFKTKPFLDKEDIFNIYYYNIPEKFVYEDSSKCKWGTKPLQNREKFDIILNKFNWIDLRVYMAKDPRLWPHAGGAIYMSEKCYGLSNVNTFAKTFTHEFGHAFGSLRDEYIYSGSSYNYNYMNCIYPKNNSRWDDVFGYDGAKYSGCTSSKSFRGTANSMMKNQGYFGESTWIGAWGSINEYYLKERIEKYE
ncbi:MAG: hypothetical protein KC589_04175 [Nanoarchaeota archaeon]|nr:hypothetical protein [Nanoarchaeota archaeon]